MRFVLWVVGIAALIFGAVVAGSIRSDIQLGVAAASFFSAFILFGLASVLGKISKLTSEKRPNE